MILYELFGIGDDEGEVAATTGTRHLPGKDVGHSAVVRNGFGNIAISIWLLAISREVGGFDHAGEHGCLGLEGGFIGCSKGDEVATHDGVPAGFGGSGKGLDLIGGDILTLDNGAAGLAGLHGYHDEVLFEEAEGHLVIGALDLLGPEIIVIVVTAEAGDADTDGVLGTGDVTVFALGVVLEAEHEAGEHLGIHLGELHGPYLLDHLTGAGAETAAVAHLKGGLQRDGDGPARMVHADVGLVDPGAGEVEAGRYTRIGRWLLAIGLLAISPPSFGITDRISSKSLFFIAKHRH